MRKALILRLTPLCAMLVLPACVAAPLSVTARAAGCAALLPPEWRNPVDAPEFDGNGNVVGDWVAYSDAVTGRLDQANERTSATIGIMERCEDRDRQAVERATRRRFLGIF